MIKSLIWHIHIEKINDDFYILAQFEMIVDSFPSFSYAQYNELEVLTKEINAYDYPSETYWLNIMQMERKAQAFSSRQD